MVTLDITAERHMSGYRKGSDFIHNQLERLSSAIGQDVLLTAPHGSAAVTIDTNQFVIYIWSTPFGLSGHIGKVTPPATISIWNQPVVADYGSLLIWYKGAYAYSGVGIDIADGNFSIAELVNNKDLYILFDIVEYSSIEARKLFTKLIDEVISIVKG